MLLPCAWSGTGAMRTSRPRSCPAPRLTPTAGTWGGAQRTSQQVNKFWPADLKPIAIRHARVCGSSGCEVPRAVQRHIKKGGKHTAPGGGGISVDHVDVDLGARRSRSSGILAAAVTRNAESPAGCPCARSPCKPQGPRQRHTKRAHATTRICLKTRRCRRLATRGPATSTSPHQGKPM